MRETLEALRAELAPLGPPVIVFNKSHSGSRLLGRLVEGAGIFMGAHQNESSDSLDVLRLVQHLVTRYYPDFGPLWRPGAETDPLLAPLVREVFAAHLAGFPAGPGRRWGWKLCETLYVLPVLDFLFPEARYVHLVRDGRDVAFCDHTPPNTPFWKKVYFNTDRIEGWRGLRMTRRDYERRSHVYNALHWANSVTVARAYGAMLRERCLEVRYEALCADFETTGRTVLEFLGAPRIDETLRELRPEVYGTSVAKHRGRSAWKNRQVDRWIGPVLASFGYDSVPSRFRRLLVAWLPVAVWCGLIFKGSTDTLSASHTSRFLTPFLHWLVPAWNDDQVETARMAIRKGGHVTEYLVLALLLWRAMPRDPASARWPMRTAVWAWAGATLYAASDEFHQSFYPSRQGSSMDVGIDSSGALLGMLLLYWFGRWRGWWGRG